jgi:hypothetical protein
MFFPVVISLSLSFFSSIMRRVQKLVPRTNFIVLIQSSKSVLTISYLTAKNAAVLSLACRAETNSIVAGTEFVSSQAAVVFW